MAEKVSPRKCFFIAAIGPENSIERKYSDLVLECCKKAIVNANLNDNSNLFADHICIQRHDEKEHVNLITKSIVDEIESSDYFIVLADYPRINRKKLCFEYNPNVWFEFGMAVTTEKPILIIKSADTTLPFDVRDIKAVEIPSNLTALLTEAFCDSNSQIVSTDEVSEQLTELISKEILNNWGVHPTSPFAQMYEISQLKRMGFHTIRELLESTQDVRFIEGEEAAFRALTEAVKKAKKFVFTTRFSNKSLYDGLMNEKNEYIEARPYHQGFTDALKTASFNVSCDRIICNNAIDKWLDVFHALADANITVYVRAANFCQHFELVVIDGDVAFIHFYSKLFNKKEKHSRISATKQDYDELQTIESSLKLRGAVCEKLSQIFIRYHTRAKNTDDKYPILSSTILGAGQVLTSSSGKTEYENVSFKPLSKREMNRYNAALNKIRSMYEKLLKALHENKNGEIKNLTELDMWTMYYGICLIACKRFPNCHIKIAPPSHSSLYNITELKKYFHDEEIERIYPTESNDYVRDGFNTLNIIEEIC